MTYKSIMVSLLASSFLTLSASYAISVDFIQRGFKSCTETCNAKSICSIEDDKIFKWCLKNCSYKIDVKKICESEFPFEARPILPYETYTGPLGTNQISMNALKLLGPEFIEQTKDRRRVVGTAKLILLVRAQFIKGTDVQKLNASEREALAEKLLLEYFKGLPSIISTYQKDKTIPDDKLRLLFKEIKSEIFAKIK